MGWDYTHVFHSGMLSNKQKIEEIECMVDPRYKVLKSSMVGSVYYGAVQNRETEAVTALVVLTRTSTKDYFNFGIKWMGETMGPCEAKCPVSILKLLTPTEDEWANEWRKRCYAYAEQRKSPKSLSKLPVGTVIRFDINGTEYEAEKRPPAYQFKRPWWYIADTDRYMPVTQIPQEFEIVA